MWGKGLLCFGAFLGALMWVCFRWDDFRRLRAENKRRREFAARWKKYRGL